MAVPIRILIVDGDVNCRDTLRMALEGVVDMEVVGSAPTGKVGLEKARLLNPDLVLLDAVLDDVSAVEFTRTVRDILPCGGVLIASKQLAAAADMTILALENGAFDFVIKPEVRCAEKGAEILRRMLIPKIRCFSIKRYSRLARGLAPPGHTVIARRADLVNLPAEAAGRFASKLDPSRIEAIAIGVSTGGPEALSHLLPAFPDAFPVPIVIVLHMPRLFTGRLAEVLNRESRLTVKEADDGDVMTAGHAYLAPGGLHLTIESGTSRRYTLRTLDTPPENGCKPSVDVLFQSAAGALKRRVLAVVLTGMGSDGTRGLALLKEQQAPVIVQDEESSVVWGMPGSAVRAGYADEVLPLGAIASRIMELVGWKR